MRKITRVVACWLALEATKGLAGTLPMPEQVTHVAPEVVHKVYRLSSPQAVVNVLEVDLRSGVELAAVKAGARVTSCAPLSQMLQELGPHIIGGINGDFFSEAGSPVGPHIQDGHVVKGGPRRAVMGMTTSGEIFVTVAQLQAQVRFPKGDTIQVSGFNRGRGTAELIVFNRWFGRTTRTNRWGTELTVSLLGPSDGSDFLPAVVTKVDTLGNVVIPPEQIVLSAHGGTGQVLRRAAVNDTLHLAVELPPAKGRLKWLIGGGPVLVYEGNLAAEQIATWGNGGFAHGRHPRTAAGYSADRATAYLVTVDGRQPGYSEGMTLAELAQLLTRLGAYQAINLDGGGSTTIVLNGKVVNRPAEDGQERPVTNAIVVRRKAAEGR